MRLEELFEERAFAWDPGKSFPTNFVAVGTCEGYTIYGSRYYKGLDTYGILDGGGNCIAMLSFKEKPQKVGRLDYHDIEGIWVDPAHRGQALAPALLDFVVRKMETPLAASAGVTIAGEALLRKLVKNKSFVFKVKDGKKLVDLDSIGVDDLFSLPNRLSLIFVEGWSTHTGDSLFEHHPFTMTRFRNDPDNAWD